MSNLNPYCAFQTLQAAKQHKFSANVNSNCHPFLVFSFPQLLNAYLISNCSIDLMRKDDLYDIQCMKLVYLSENQDFKLGSLNFDHSNE